MNIHNLHDTTVKEDGPHFDFSRWNAFQTTLVGIIVCPATPTLLIAEVSRREVQEGPEGGVSVEVSRPSMSISPLL